MSASMLFSLVAGLAFVGGAVAGWRTRASMTPAVVPSEHDELLAVQRRYELLRESSRTASERTASLEFNLTSALMATTHLEMEVDRLAQALEEAEAEAASASAWVREIWREHAFSQGAPDRHPSARRDERGARSESAPGSISRVRATTDGPAGDTERDRARWN